MPLAPDTEHYAGLHPREGTKGMGGETKEEMKEGEGKRGREEKRWKAETTLPQQSCVCTAV